MQILTPEAARAEIINKDFTSPETVLSLPSFDQSVQHLPQHSLENTSSENRLWSDLDIGKTSAEELHKGGPNKFDP